MKTSKPKTKFNFIENTLWIIKLNLRYAPFITFTRVLGVLRNYTSGLASSFVIGLIVDWLIKYVQNNRDNKYLIYSIIAFGTYYVFNSLASTLNNYGENMIGFKMNTMVPEMLLQEKVNKLGTASLEDPKIQNLMNRYRENRSVFQDMTRTLLNVIASIVTFALAFIAIFKIMPLIGVLVVLVSIPGLLLNNKVINSLWKLDKSMTEASRRAYGIYGLVTQPEALKEIKLLGSFKYLLNYFENYTNTYYSRKNRIYVWWTILDLVTTIFTVMAILFGIYQIIQFIVVGQISIGALVFYVSALLSIASNIDNFSSNITSYAGNIARLSEIHEFLTYPEEDNSKKTKIARLNAPPLIEIKDVSFVYPNSEKEVIKNLNLTIKPGEKIAIVGENGAGKTTLVKLISNIYPVTKGEILVDSRNLNTIEPDSWFENLGVLYQDYNTYNDLTVKENIALGRINKEINIKELQDAAVKADADKFIAEFNDQFEQVLSEKYKGGTRPSTGQWQKIAIARFFYRNAPILILDEPTASIDAVAEANIFDRIYKFIENKTVIIISHRFSTVRNADRIIVFDKGKIVEQGTHQELLEKDGTYAKAFKLQAKGYSS